MTAHTQGVGGGDHLLRADVATASPVFVRGEGVELVDDLGRRYLDAASGVGVTALGYSAHDVSRAMYEQAETLPYLHALRFESPPARHLADLIAQLAPGDLDHVFFTSGGSEANESAFKFVRQYWLERGEPSRWQIIGRKPSFHGNTLATLSAGWHEGRRKRHAPLLLEFSHIESPNSYRGCSHCGHRDEGCDASCADQLEAAIRRAGPDTVAAFIAEPVIGAAAGALVAPAGYFGRVREVCDAYGVLFIADEVITGFGRLGRWFGIERFDARPDLLVFAKGVSAGYAPLGGFVARRPLVDTFRSGSGRFEHNFTMAGHPVACAAGVAAVMTLQREGLIDRAASLEGVLFSELRAGLTGLPIVGDIRGLGLLAGVEFVADRRTKAPFPPGESMAARVAAYGREEGVLVYACQGGVNGDAGDYILVMPPLVSSEEQIHEMVGRLRSALERLCRDLGLFG